MTKQPNNEESPQDELASNANNTTCADSPAADTASIANDADSPAGDTGSVASETAKFAPQPKHAEGVIRKRHKTSHAKKRKRNIVIALCVAVLLIAGIALGAFAFIKAGEGALKSPMANANPETSEEAATYDEGKTVTYEGKKYILNENMVSVLMIGFDRKTIAQEGENAGQADAVFVMAIDTEKGTVQPIILPRDSMVDVDLYAGDRYVGQEKMQLCLAYGYGDGRESSCENTARAASRLLYNIPIEYFFSLDMNSIGPLADAIGGVSLTPLQTVTKANAYEGQPTVLFGKNALYYVQYRDTSVSTSSLDRQARQKQFLEAYFSQALQAAKGDVGVLVNLYNLAGEYAITNLGANEFSYLASVVQQNGMTTLNATALTGEMSQPGKNSEYTIDQKAAYEIVLNTYYTPVEEEQ